MDEIFNAEKDLLKKYGEEKEICSILQDAILNPQTVPFSFNSTVCISSLNLKVLGKNFSGRRVNALDIPSTLNTTRIIKEWWRCPKEDQRIMLCVAACVNSLPRAVNSLNPTRILKEWWRFNKEDECRLRCLLVILLIYTLFIKFIFIGFQTLFVNYSFSTPLAVIVFLVSYSTCVS